MNLSIFLSFIWLLFQPSFSISNSHSGFTAAKQEVTEWVVADLLQSQKADIKISGDPKVIDCKYGKAVLFNGKDDGIFVNEMPLKGLAQFTVEILIRFDRGGEFEQRYFHCGEVQGNRLLMEMRSNPTNWYLDTYVNSKAGDNPLISPELTHPLDQWYHVAFVVKDGMQVNYINGKKELVGNIGFSPLMTGQTSIGVRQNKVAWFKGAIYKIRITGKALSPSEFMDR